MRNDTILHWWCPDCKNWFQMDESCNCPEHESSGKSRKREHVEVVPKKKKIKRGE